MRKSTIIFLIPLLLLSAVALAGPALDRARRNSLIARLALDAAQRRLTEAETDGDRLRLEMDRVRDQQRDLDRRRNRMENLSRDLPGMIGDEEDRLPKLENEIRDREQRVAALGPSLRTAIDQLREAIAGVKDIRAKYVAQLQASDPWKQAVIAAEIAAKNQAATHRGTLDRLRSSPAYRTAAENFSAAKARLAILKRDAAALLAERAEAAARLIETESAIVRMESETLAGDEDLALAKADARRKEAALAEMIAQFERDLPRQADMADALEANAKAQREADAADAALMLAETALATARSNLAISKAAIADYKDQQVRVAADLAAAVREEAQLTRDLDRLGRLAQESVTAVNRARRDVDIADRRYRDALAYERVAARIDAQNEQKP